MSRPRRFSAATALALLQQNEGDSEDDIEITNGDSEEEQYYSDENEDSDNEIVDNGFDVGHGDGDTAYMVARDGTKWKKETNASTNGRRSSKNILRHRGGSKQFILSRIDDELDIFSELFGPNTLESIRNYTLAEANRQGIDDFTLTMDELQAFLGLAIIRGVTKGKNEPLCSFWNSTYGPSIFRETISRTKYFLILKLLRFDSKDTRESRKANDKFAPIRDVWNTVMDNCQKCFFPFGSVTIDEQLFSCKSRCSFIQYMPQKPGKFGLKFWLICDTKTSYVLRAEPYTGSDEQRELPLGEHVVMKLMQPYFQTGLNVTTDNFFTSLRVAQSLLQKDITIVGTLRSNRREIPVEMQMTKERLYSSKFAFSVDDDIMLTSYKAKRNKTVFLLSSAHDRAEVDDTTEKNKPHAILSYNSEKGGVDTADQMLRSYSTKSASRRWPLAAFFNLLDIVCLNSYIIAVDCGMTKGNRRDFLIHLGEKLCFKERSRRAKPILEHLDDTCKLKPCVPVLPPGKRTTCRKCQKNKTRDACCSCGVFVCGSCAKLICKDCF